MSTVVRRVRKPIVGWWRSDTSLDRAIRRCTLVAERSGDEDQWERMLSALFVLHFEQVYRRTCRAEAAA